VPLTRDDGQWPKKVGERCLDGITISCSTSFVSFCFLSHILAWIISQTAGTPWPSLLKALCPRSRRRRPFRRSASSPQVAPVNVCRGNIDEQNGADEDALIRSDDPEHPANLIPELCRGFYSEL
jgi:hypothetical protein